MSKKQFYDLVPTHTSLSNDELNQTIIDAGFQHRICVKLKSYHGGLAKLSKEYDYELDNWTFHGDGNMGNYFFKRLEDAVWARLVL